MRTGLCILATMTAVSAMPARAADAETEARASYGITFLGLTVAKANYALKVKDGLYTSRLGYKTSGMVQIVSEAKGEAQAGGALRGGKVIAASYVLKSEEGEQSKDVSIAMEAGAVKTASAEPPLKNLDKRVPMTPALLKNVVDPLSALLFPIAKPDTPLDPSTCARIAPIFDGWTRYDISFTFKGLSKVKLPGYKGSAITCAARWTPVGGHRPDANGTKFMAGNKDMEATLIPTSTGFLIPVAVSVKTLTGTVVIAADRVKVDRDEDAAKAP